MDQTEWPLVSMHSRFQQSSTYKRMNENLKVAICEATHPPSPKNPASSAGVAGWLAHIQHDKLSYSNPHRAAMGTHTRVTFV